MAINANANGIPFLKRTGIPPAIKNSMVVYYDIKKQGCTNESMKANPKLIDLSGNGHDAVLNNFAWKGMSGIGGYGIINLSDWIFNIPEGVTIINDNKIKVKGNITQIIRCTIDESTTFKLSVKGATQDNPLYIRFIQNKLLDIVQDGVYDIELSYKDDVLNLVEIGCQEEITIEQLPFYPSALVFDGVDDYGVVEDVPIFMPEVGFTVIVKRKILDTGKYCVASCSPSDSKGAFLFELGAIGSQDSITILYPNTAIYSFGKGIHTAALQTNDISYMKSNQYNDITLTKGSDNSTAPLIIGRRTATDGRLLKGVIYSLMLFNRDLTTEEIEFVKQKYFSD